MGIIKLTWDNTAVNASANATGQRASKRIKSIGGAYSTVGFNPVNDLPKTANTTDATVDDNKVYEFKVEALCSSGGPVPNINGVQEGISFACIVPAFAVTHNSIQVTVNLLNTDITKVRFRLKKDSDDSTVGTVTVNNVGNQAQTTFNALDPATNYYVEIELYAVVNGVEVISSSVDYLNAVCGGNVENYQVSTDAAPACPAPTALEVEQVEE